MNLPTVAIVGRPNVGKSSLFNRILKRRFAVVEETPGVTRDRNYADADWIGRYFTLVDTGGIDTTSKELMIRLIADQAQFAIHESDVVMFLVDCLTGVDDDDREIAKQLSRSNKKVILVANKADTDEIEREIYEFMKLGLGEPLPVSALSGRGIGELLDELVEHLPEFDEPENSDAIRIALVGRPNVGKSSFINKLTGYNRLLVTPIAGTTRDAVDTHFKFNDKDYVLIDTAGLRRKYKVHENIEFYTTLRTSRAIDNCDVAVVLIDAQEGMMSQDQRILDQVITKRKAAVLAINKWDLVEKDTFTADKFTRDVKDVLAKFDFLPIIYISALTGQRVEKVLTIADQVNEEATKRIQTAELNNFLEEAVSAHHPPSKQGKQVKFYYMTQTEIKPPTFIFFTNQPKLISKTYISYLTNKLRDKFGFLGVPIRLKFQRK